jgi:hypothetical protein
MAAAFRPQPQPPQLSPWPDDPHGQERAELTALSLDYGKQAIMARDSGRTEAAREWRARQVQVETALAKLPPAPQETYVREALEEGDSKAVDLLFDPKRKDDSCWEDPRVQADAAVLVAKVNRSAKTRIRLPMEESPFGAILPSRPENMVEVPVPADVAERFKRLVYSTGEGADPEKIFRRSWSALRGLGYAALAKRAFEGGEQSEGREKSPEQETYKEYAARMNKKDQKRRRPFVFPKPRR